MHILEGHVRVWKREELADVLAREVDDLPVLAVDESTICAVRVVNLLVLVWTLVWAWFSGLLV